MNARRSGCVKAPAWVNEDFMFLERARGTSFVENWNFRDALGGYYRPLTRNVYFWIGERLFGRDPIPYHLLNVAVAMAGLVLFFLVTRHMLAAACGPRGEHREPAAPVVGPALIAVLLFALHPTAGTPVSWISGIQDLLAVALVLGAVLAHFARRRIAYAVLMAAAILSKEIVVSMPIVLWVYDLAVERASWRQATRRQAGALAIVAIWAIGNRWLPWNDLGSTVHSVEAGERKLLGRFDLGTVRFTFESLVLIEPREGFTWFFTTGDTFLMGVLVAAVLGLAHSCPWPDRPQVSLFLVGALWSVLGIVPLIAVISHFYYYAFYPALGASVAAAAALVMIMGSCSLRFGRSLARVATAAIAVLGVGCLAAGAGFTHRIEQFDAHEVRRSSRYLSSFRSDLARLHPTLPDSARCYFWNIPPGLGFQLIERRALRVWLDAPGVEGHDLSSYTPDTAHPAFFFAHDGEGHLFEIVPAFPDPLLEAPPSLYSDAHSDLGTRFAEVGDAETAIAEWRKALKVDPDHASASANLGITLLGAGRYEEAAEALVRAASLNPEDADLRLYLGLALADLGQHTEAKREIEAFLALKPDSPRREQATEILAQLERLLRKPEPGRGSPER